MGGRRTTISIHAPREGGDRCLRGRVRCRHHFNPRPPRGGRRAAPKRPNNRPEFQSTPPARGATLFRFHFCFSYDKFQSTPPARGATWYITASPPDTPRFQSTPPARGATRGNRSAAVFLERFQSTPPARGATSSVATVTPTAAISIHAPREGGDAEVPHHSDEYTDFNPRPPRGGRHNDKIHGLHTTPFQSTPPARGATESEPLSNRP